MNRKHFLAHSSTTELFQFPHLGTTLHVPSHSFQEGPSLSSKAIPLYALDLNLNPEEIQINTKYCEYKLHILPLANILFFLLNGVIC